jgi:hypothetical protein
VLQLPIRETGKRSQNFNETNPQSRTTVTAFSTQGEAVKIVMIFTNQEQSIISITT